MSPMALVLVGQSELWDKLKLQRYAAARYRIDISCVIPHLDGPRPSITSIHILSMLRDGRTSLPIKR